MKREKELKSFQKRLLSSFDFSLVLFVLLAALLSLVGIYGAFWRSESNRCRSLDEQGAYVPLMKQGKYQLFVYEEEFSVRFRRKNITYTGVPVLFIPGHAGSNEQGITIASVATKFLKKSRPHKRILGGVDRRRLKDRMRDRFKVNTNSTLWDDGEKQMDFFSIDFGEEFSAFHGDLLWRQTHFINHCVRYILSLYKPINGCQVPSSVMLIAHSMGGISSRAIFLLEDYVDGSVRTILTLGTPHRASPFPIDESVSLFYHTVNSFWKSRNPKLKHVVLVSISGGSQDTLIASELSDPFKLIPSSHNIFVTSSSIPFVWIPIDHNSLPWCGQLIETITSILDSLIDVKTCSIHESVAKRMETFSRYLIKSAPQAAIYRENDAFLNGSRHYSHSHAHTIKYFPLKRNHTSKSYLLLTEPPSKRLSIYVFNLTKYQLRNRSNFVMLTNSLQEPLIHISLVRSNRSLTLTEKINPNWHPVPALGFQTLFSSMAAHPTSLMMLLSAQKLRGYEQLRLSILNKIPTRKSSTNCFTPSFFLLAQFFRLNETVLDLNSESEVEVKKQSILTRFDFTASSSLPTALRISSIECNVSSHSAHGPNPLFKPIIGHLIRGEESDQDILYYLEHYENSTERIIWRDRESTKFHLRRGYGKEDRHSFLILGDPACSYKIKLTRDWIGLCADLIRWHGVKFIPFVYYVYLGLVALSLYKWSSTGVYPDFVQIFRQYGFRLTLVGFFIFFVAITFGTRNAILWDLNEEGLDLTELQESQTKGGTDEGVQRWAQISSVDLGGLYLYEIALITFFVSTLGLSTTIVVFVSFVLLPISLIKLFLKKLDVFSKYSKNGLLPLATQGFTMAKRLKTDRLKRRDKTNWMVTLSFVGICLFLISIQPVLFLLISAIFLLIILSLSTSRQNNKQETHNFRNFRESVLVLNVMILLYKGTCLLTAFSNIFYRFSYSHAYDSSSIAVIPVVAYSFLSAFFMVPKFSMPFSASLISFFLGSCSICALMFSGTVLYRSLYAVAFACGVLGCSMIPSLVETRPSLLFRRKGRN
eukprot:TRINITY_DN17382_c0_g1_i1.p1 TRINITY_DN17382_c0_g1~~TRINITY_DN17382_c0_g1_i1.p1  ORF type:complete len:1044 (+),score=131.68 TRINITY_DN17382_c0_g1_i1:51-3182(+)